MTKSQALKWKSSGNVHSLFDSRYRTPVVATITQTIRSFEARVGNGEEATHEVFRLDAGIDYVKGYCTGLWLKKHPLEPAPSISEGEAA